ncbi:hypothetical protein L6452_04113 [Arctium lappa]|uniref:Uncharacterized protein n=1 Tax=Arctium lappa TaxID=4217 RepID=A0ACB9FPR3_ARCLA|nr:hypothetical protein L6452_04113 [Arctium lappa]
MFHQSQSQSQLRSAFRVIEESHLDHSDHSVGVQEGNDDINLEMEFERQRDLFPNAYRMCKVRKKEKSREARGLGGNSSSFLIKVNGEAKSGSVSRKSLSKNDMYNLWSRSWM